MPTTIPPSSLPLAAPGDVASAWRPLSSAEVDVATTLLEYASALVRAALPDVDARVASGALDRGLVRYVVASMVKRVLSNPEGKRQESIDDYSYTRDGSVSAGELYISDQERSMLAAAPVAVVAAAYTVGLG